MGRRTVISICVAAALLATAPAGATAGGNPSAGDGAFAAVGRTLLAALAVGHPGVAVEALGDSLVVTRAQKRVAREASLGADRQLPAPAEEVKDPARMPPASAGSNGTSVPHASSLSRAEIFAHSRQGNPEMTAILLTGVALSPPNAPEAVKGAINAANTIVGRPYVWGGGHGSFYSNGYDCSGAVSFALFGGGLIPEPLTSTSLEHWGAPGPGKWITVYANASHAFAEIAGLRWDTVGDAQGTGPRWHLLPTDTSGFVVRHPPGL